MKLVSHMFLLQFLFFAREGIPKGAGSIEHQVSKGKTNLRYFLWIEAQVSMYQMAATSFVEPEGQPCKDQTKILGLHRGVVGTSSDPWQIAHWDVGWRFPWWDLWRRSHRTTPCKKQELEQEHVGYKLPFSSLPFLPLSCFFSSRFFSCLVVRHKKKREGVREKKQRRREKRKGGKRYQRRERKEEKKHTWRAERAPALRGGNCLAIRAGGFFFCFTRSPLLCFFVFVNKQLDNK